MKKPEKNQSFNGIRTRDLRDTGAMLYQLSYEATHWERGQFCWVLRVLESSYQLLTHKADFHDFFYYKYL